MVDRHVPVLLDRVLELLGPAASRPGAVAVDATVGLGGHAAALLTRHPQLRLIGLDRDPEAVALARERLAEFGDRAEVLHTAYDALPDLLDERGLAAADAVLFDLGVSSLQLDTDERGFAYSRETPLDMRMDSTQGRTAADVVNGYDRGALASIFRRYGEERFADRVAARIVAARERQPLTTTAELAEVVRDAIPAATRRTGGHPAKRVFQALRIEVNGELDLVDRGVAAALDRLAPGGRIVVLAYHSLEDRIVKQEFARRARASVPPDVPVTQDKARPELELLTRGAEKASDAEQAANPRARSVRLRAAQRQEAAS